MVIVFDFNQLPWPTNLISEGWTVRCFDCGLTPFDGAILLVQNPTAHIPIYRCELHNKRKLTESEEKLLRKRARDFART